VNFTYYSLVFYTNTKPSYHVFCFFIQVALKQLLLPLSWLSWFSLQDDHTAARQSRWSLTRCCGCPLADSRWPCCRKTRPLSLMEPLHWLRFLRCFSGSWTSSRTACSARETSTIWEPALQRPAHTLIWGRKTHKHLVFEFEFMQTKLLPKCFLQQLQIVVDFFCRFVEDTKRALWKFYTKVLKIIIKSKLLNDAVSY